MSNPRGKWRQSVSVLFGNRIGIEPNTQYYTNMEANVYGKKICESN